VVGRIHDRDVNEMWVDTFWTPVVGKLLGTMQREMCYDTRVLADKAHFGNVYVCCAYVVSANMSYSGPSAPVYVKRRCCVY
jgi:hypothetical protein